MEDKKLAKNENAFYVVLEAGMRMPLVKIDRTEFLRRELSNHFKPELVELAIERNPAYAGITTSQINSIARASISFETNWVSATSAAAGVPGGLALIATAPADLTQYFGHLLRILQKLAYLYGWKEFYNIEGEFDDEAQNRLTLFMGVMFGVGAANIVIARLAKQAAIGVEKQLVNAALTKGFVYPIVKKVAQLLGSSMTKEIFAKSVSKAVPVVGAVLSGGLTYATFLPLANRLKKYLEKLPTSDVEFYKTEHDETSGALINDVEDR